MLPSKQPELRKLVPFGPLTKYDQLNVIHLTLDSLREPLAQFVL